MENNNKKGNTLDAINEFNVFIHNNLEEFVEVILSDDNFHNRLFKNRCKDPFRQSKDNDLSYNEQTGSWYDFGGTHSYYGSSFDLVRKLKFGNEPNFKKQVALTFELLTNWRNGRDNKIVYFRKYAEKSPQKPLSLLLAEKLEESNSNIAEAYVLDNMKKWFKRATISRFTLDAIEKYHICETTNKLPRGLNFFHYYYFYMIYNEKGELVGLQGRRKDDNNTAIPKMYNLKGFSKTDVIYGLDIFKKANPTSDTIYLCEGQGDVVRAYELMQHPCMCALMGKSISKEQINIVKKYYKTVVLCLDNDGPGHQGAKKCAKALLQAGLNVKITHVLTKKDIGALTLKQELAGVLLNAFSVYLSDGKVKLFDSSLNVLKTRRKLKKAFEQKEKEGK